HGRIFGQKPLGTITTAKSGGLGMTTKMAPNLGAIFLCDIPLQRDGKETIHLGFTRWMAK
uniref:hypothetical protein n=1 Tax=Vibrio cholerae TaxID=666 RepID=UPI001CA344DD